MFKLLGCFLLSLSVHLIYGSFVTTFIADNEQCKLANGTEEVCTDRQVFEDSEWDALICGTSDKMCLQYHEIDIKLNCQNCVNIPENVKYLEVRNVTSLSADRSSREIDYIDEYDPWFTYIVESDCRNNRQLFRKIQNSKLANETSFSPWKYMINLDENRIPREILETKCLCTNCLNSSRNKINSAYTSVPLTVTRYFQLKGNGSTVFHAEFSYGCVCERNVAA